MSNEFYAVINILRILGAFGVVIIVTYLLLKRRKKRMMTKSRTDQLEQYKLHHGYYLDPRNKSDHCQKCGSKNVEYRGSHLPTSKIGAGSEEGGTTIKVEIESIYTYTCKDCGHMWQRRDDD